MDPEKGVYYFNANTGESAWGDQFGLCAMLCLAQDLNLAWCDVEHPMDDYYRKLFKSLHKNKEEMVQLNQEQSLFQLSQIGLKVCVLHPSRNV